MPDPSEQPMLYSTAGDHPLHQCRLHVGDREWTVLYTGAVLSFADEQAYFTGPMRTLPYGVVLWSSAIALAHEVATRPAEFRGRTVLELGAGTGLPGVVAASLGAKVVQTDRQETAMHVCRMNGERNGVSGIEYREVDWEAWDDPARYDWIVGSDVLYGEAMHPHLRRIFETSLAPGGRVLLADPFRDVSLKLLEPMEKDGWRVTMSRWTVGDDDTPRKVAVYELAPPE